MIVRTYGRRSRGGISTTLSDSLDDNDAFDPYTDSFSSQEAPHDVYAFSSQGSTHFDSDPAYADCADGTVLRKSKKQRKGEAKGRSRDIAELGLEDYPMLRATSTLMETQEFGEMMEHVDEVNFALDGLRKGQPVRIRRASLLSLLGICGTAQQRRLLRTHGMVKTIIDSLVGLSLDDSPSNLASATLFYLFISDGLDELLLESSSCIHFLIKLLNPVISTPAEDRNPGIGSKLLRLRKDAENLCGRDSKSDRNSTIIFSRVEEILCSCKELNSTCGDDSRTGRPELSPKWIALLAMEKASFSTIALEETSGIIRKRGGNFKEKLREFGGLDAVFEVATHCHSIMEEWRDVRHSSSLANAKDDVHLESLLLLLKFLKIMENATFLSQDNQNYLLQMRGKRDSRGSRLSFTKLLLSAIEILSGLFLDKRSFASGLKADQKVASVIEILSTEMSSPADTKADEAFSIRSFKGHCSIEGSSSQRSDTYRDHHCLSSSSLGHSTSSAEMKPSSTNGSYSMKANFSSAPASRLSGETSKSSTARGTGLIRNGLKNFDKNKKSDVTRASVFEFSERLEDPFAFDEDEGEPSKCSTAGGTGLIRNGLKNFGKNKKSDVTRASAFEFSERVEDPFAFDEDECEPSKWEVLSGKKVQSRNKTNALAFEQAEAVSQLQQQLVLHSVDDIPQSLPESSTSHQTAEISGSQATDGEHCSLIADCLLSAVKVLMNLTNDNPVGCRQIAACGGLETMASVIACHYPSFGSSSSSSSLCEIQEYGVKILFEETKPTKQQFSDQEMDLLVAILGLLVNLVEKDDDNRSRLATCCASLRSTQGGSDYEGAKEVIPLLCSIFLAHRTESETAGEEVQNLDAEEMILQGKKEAEKMIVEAYAALLLAFLSTESKTTRRAIASCLPNHKLSILIPVLEKFVAFHLTLEMMTPETHKIVIEVIESLRIP